MSIWPIIFIIIALVVLILLNTRMRPVIKIEKKLRFSPIAIGMQLNIANDLMPKFMEMCKRYPHLDGQNLAHSLSNMVIDVMNSYVVGKIPNSISEKLALLWEKTWNHNNKNGIKSHADLKHLNSIFVDDVKFNDDVLKMKILINSDQVRYTKQNGKLISGDPKTIDTITDVWEIRTNPKERELLWQITETY